MSSEPKRSFARVMNEAVRKAYIGESTRERLIRLWQRYRWKKGLSGFHGVVYVLSLIAIVGGAGWGVYDACEAGLLDSLFAWFESAGEILTAFFALFREGLGFVSDAVGVVLGAARSLVAAILAFLFDVLAFLLDFVVRGGRWIGDVVWEAAGHLWSLLAGAGVWLYETAAAAFRAFWEVFGEFFVRLYELAVAAAGWVGATIADAARFLWNIAGNALCWLYDQAAAAAGSVYGFLSGIAAHLWDLAGRAASYLYEGAGSLAAGIWRWLAETAEQAYRLAVRTIAWLTWWYWITMPSMQKVISLFAASMLAEYAAWKLANSGGRRALVRPARVLGAALFTWMLAHLLELYAIEYSWEGLELVSMGMWSMVPLFVAVMTGRRPLLYEAVALFLLVVHLLVFAAGVSGNVLVAFDLSLAVMLIVGADVWRNRLGADAAVLRYTAMAVICFILYCSGFIWDLPAVLEFRANASRPSLPISRLFIMPVLALAAGLAVWSYWRKGRERTRHDALFTLLLLGTLLLSSYSTGILLYSVSVGTIYDLTGGGYNLSIFSGNAVLASMFAWAGWFLWCLWLLVESSDRNNGLMAQIAVTALLGSLETRYVEVVKNISLVAGLAVLPLMLVLVLAEIGIIRRWLRNLESQTPAPLPSEGSTP